MWRRGLLGWTGAGLGLADLSHTGPHQSCHPGLSGCPQTSCAGSQWGRAACFHFHLFQPTGETHKSTRAAAMSFERDVIHQC